MLDALLDAVIDSLKILPFLFLTYLVMEYLESHTEDHVRDIVKRAGWMGPFWGGLLGAVPQCGFSAAASNLYAGRAISLGTLIAIFLSTSDEMLPIMISEAVPVNRMMKILLVKLIIGIITGFVIDGICHLISSRKTGQPDDGEDFLIERLCEKEHCHCESGSIVISALKHTGNIILFVFQMYLHGVLPASHLIAGLLDGAGVGVLILFRVNPDMKENAKIVVLLYILAVIFGLLIYCLGLSF